ncbi:MAG: hypothetical protein ACJAZ3_001904 [Sphingobacteriales bacterium]|jgi:hypothetical protein
MNKKNLFLVIALFFSTVAFSQASLSAGLFAGAIVPFQKDIVIDKAPIEAGISANLNVLKHFVGIQGVYLNYSATTVNENNIEEAFDAQYVGAGLTYSYRYLKLPVFYMGVGATARYYKKIEGASTFENPSDEISPTVLNYGLSPSIGISVPFIEVELRPELYFRDSFSENFDASFDFLPTIELRYKFF